MSIMHIEIICCPPKRILIQRDLDAKIGNEKDPKLAIRVEGLKPKNLWGGEPFHEGEDDAGHGNVFPRRSRS